MEKNLQKIVMVSFVAASLIAAYMAKVLLEVLAASVGSFAPIYDSLLVRHGVPFLVGAGVFLALILKKNVKLWANEVVVEISKIVWPSKKDTTTLTIVVTAIIIISGILLGIFDYLSRHLVEFVFKIPSLF